MPTEVTLHLNCQLKLLSAIELPTAFLLPDFDDQEQKISEDFDFFNMDHRTIMEIWVDYAKTYIRDSPMGELLDRYINIARIMQYLTQHVIFSNTNTMFTTRFV